jgi:hypothetical protein
MTTVALSVLAWFELSYIVLCIRNGEHLLRRCGFCVK